MSHSYTSASTSYSVTTTTSVTQQTHGGTSVHQRSKPDTNGFRKDNPSAHADSELIRPDIRRVRHFGTINTSELDMQRVQYADDDVRLAGVVEDLAGSFALEVAVQSDGKKIPDLLLSHLDARARSPLQRVSLVSQHFDAHLSRAFNRISRAGPPDEPWCC
jgi:hypothetical protein